MADTTESGALGQTGGASEGEVTRRDFLYLATAGMGAVAAAGAAWPFIDYWNPSADVLALASTEVDLTPIEVGQSITAVWRGKPVFIRHRTEEEIKKAEDVDWQALPDPEPDSERVENPAYLIVVGVCTHLGCVPLGQKSGEPRGEWDGWFCPCHGSHYDTSGRIRKGPAPANLVVPGYQIAENQTVTIG